MFIKSIRTTIFKNGDDLANFIFRFIPKIKEKTTIVVTSRIVALAQGRTVPGKISEKEKEDWIRRESESYIKTKWCYLALANDHWCANAGIDESNVENKGIILWPKNPYAAAENLRKKLKKMYHVSNLGILITDSRIYPLRSGVTGVAIGYSGFKGLHNYIGKKDIFSRRLKMTKANIADSLATAAVLEMGEGNEQTPLAIIEDANIAFTQSKVKPDELRINPNEDMYKPLYNSIN